MEQSTYYTDPATRLKIDDLLRKNASLEASLGIDSTQKEQSKIKAKQDVIFDNIKSLDKEFYKTIMAYDEIEFKKIKKRVEKINEDLKKLKYSSSEIEKFWESILNHAENEINP